MAAGWSPAGEYGLTTSNGTPVRSISPTGRCSECASASSGSPSGFSPSRAEPGTSVANAMASRLTAPPDSGGATASAGGQPGPSPPLATRCHELRRGAVS